MIRTMRADTRFWMPMFLGIRQKLTKRKNRFWEQNRKRLKPWKNFQKKGAARSLSCGAILNRNPVIGGYVR